LSATQLAIAIYLHEHAVDRLLPLTVLAEPLDLLRKKPKLYAPKKLGVKPSNGKRKREDRRQIFALSSI
jgi:hypothetical protein